MGRLRLAVHFMSISALGLLAEEATEGAEGTEGTEAAEATEADVEEAETTLSSRSSRRGADPAAPLTQAWYRTKTRRIAERKRRSLKLRLKSNSSLQSSPRPSKGKNRPKSDPFGGARPVDTKMKDLAFDERRKKDPPAKPQSTDPGLKPQGEEVQDHPPELPPKPHPPAPQAELPKPPPAEVKLNPIAADFKSEDPTVLDSKPTDPDWDFSDSHAHHSRGSRAPRVPLTQRYVRVPRYRGDRKGPDTPVSVPEKAEEAEKPVEVPKTRKRAWTSEEDDKAVINHPPIQVEAKVEVRVEEPVTRGRGWRGRGRPR